MKKFLLIKPSSLGDVIHTFPVVSAIADQVPGAVIDWVVRPEYAEIVSALPAVRKVLLFERKKWSRLSRIPWTVPELIRFVGTLRKERYDAVLDLQGLFRSGFLSFLSGSSLRFGFENAREFSPVFYNRRVRVPNERIHAIERYQLFLKALDLKASGPEYRLQVTAATDRSLDDLLSSAGGTPVSPMVVLNPNARWETKRWLPERFAALADRLVAELKAEVLFVGSPADKEAVERIVSSMEQKARNLAGRTSLLELAALLKRADLLVTCDSGPMHLAAALGTKVVALFGPTDPVRTGPYGEGHRVIRAGIPCAPCLKRDCPDETTACMADIRVVDVFQAAVSMLGDGKEGGEKSKAIYYGHGEEQSQKQ